MAHRALSRLCQHSRCIQQRSLASQSQIGAWSLVGQCAAGQVSGLDSQARCVKTAACYLQHSLAYFFAFTACYELCMP
ncbi:hypothetical protein WJX77_010759 [Trebouxia sp. C0004]